MYISLNWLKDYIDFPKNIIPQKIAEDLTISTVEVESIMDQAQIFNKMVAGKVIELKKHPNADKLKIAITDIGQTKPAQIVCGGMNLREGMLVAVALPGAKVRWHGQGEPMVLEEVKIRGEKSFGMICASNEIGIESMFPGGEMEIADLSDVKGVYPGQALAQALGLDDVIIEIDNKSLTNRPDLWSHYGIARELAAIYNLKLKDIEKYPISECPTPENASLKISIKDKSLCKRYIGVVVKNIKIDKSPNWLAKRLEAVGQRAINNIVDITNYVMHDIGEPTHAFDKSKVKSQKPKDVQIIIRKVKKGEKIKTLDGEERELGGEMLVIADEKGPIALAGIMGGANSEVNSRTTEIILEAATFDAINIRKTSQKLNHRTESSIRFEKNLDSNLAEIAMLRMLKLIKEIIPQAEVVEWADEYPVKQKEIKLKVKHSFLEKRIGQEFSLDKALTILKSLGFGVETRSANLANNTKGRASGRAALLQDAQYNISVPSWRATGDISIQEDIVEEVARIYGYDNLKEKVEMIEMEKAKYQLKHDLENKIKNYLSLGCGMDEVFNYPWAEEKTLKDLGMLNEGNLIEITNPPAKESKYLQPSLIPNLIKNIKDNLRFFDEFKIFELARVFTDGTNKWDEKMRDILPEQPKMLAGAIVGGKDKQVFLRIKGRLEGLFENLGLTIYELRIGKPAVFLDKDRFLQIFIGDDEVGWLGEIKYKIKNKNIALFEINWERLVACVERQLSNAAGEHAAFKIKYQPLPQYPSIERDLAVEVDWKVKWGDLKNAILSEAKNPLVQEISFLSEYDLGDKKSLAFRVTYQADRTLKDDEVEVVQNKVIKLLEKKFGAKLRG